MSNWEYAISVHRADEIMAGRVPGEVKRVLYCGSEGECFFDAPAKPYLAAMVDVLNERGTEGWILVQVVLREADMICFWRRERDAASP